MVEMEERNELVGAFCDFVEVTCPRVMDPGGIGKFKMDTCSLQTLKLENGHRIAN